MFAHNRQGEKRCMDDTGPAALHLRRAGANKTLPAKIGAKAVFTSIALNELKKENFCCLKQACLAYLRGFEIKSELPEVYLCAFFF